MTDKDLSFDDLIDQVLSQLKEKGYMDSTLITYRRTYIRVRKYINERGTDIYTSNLGKEFLHDANVKTSTLKAYACAIRRLDDFITQKPYRLHHGEPPVEVIDIFKDILDGFIDDCKQNGNKERTILVKKKICTLFLNFIEQSGCFSLEDLNVELISKAILIFSNKDNYAIIRQFLKYLVSKGITISDFSGIIPKYKRRKILPTTYTPNEIKQIESSINCETNTGKRDLAIIMLATRMGLRSGDIAKLRCSEINFDTRKISIIQEKTGQPITLEIPREVLNAILQHLGSLNFIPKDEFVFHSMKAPYERITTSIIRHVVLNGFINAGIDISNKKHGPHSFRSSLASSMINDGASYEVVRKILGHTDPDIIKHYARTDIEKLRMCSIDPPEPSGILNNYLTGKQVIRRV